MPIHDASAREHREELTRGRVTWPRRHYGAGRQRLDGRPL